jgi:molecular chaperone GrpE
MTQKKNHQQSQPEEVDQTGAEAVGTPEINEQAGSKEEALRKQLEEAEAKSAENLDGWQRAVAEFQNYKKRAERDNETMYITMKGDIIKKILPVLDDLERAMQNRPSDTGPWIDGIELIHKKLRSLLEAEGLKRIQAEGEVFDPNFHEAISHEPSDTVESGHVIAVTQNGYMLADRVLRPAVVRVAQ